VQLAVNVTELCFM